MLIAVWYSMQFFPTYSFNRALVLLVIITCLGLGSAQAALVPDANIATMDRITALDVDTSAGATVINIQGNGSMPALATRTIASPPRIVIDLLTAAPRFKSIIKQVYDSNLKSIRVGHHPVAIRMVLDVNGSAVPRFSISRQGKILVVHLKSAALGGYPDPNLDGGLSKIDKHKDGQERLKPIKNMTNAAPAAPKQIESDLRSRGADATDKESSNQERVPANVINKLNVVDLPGDAVEKIFDAEAELIQLNMGDQPYDINAYINAVIAYRANNWPGAIDHLEQFIQASEANIFVEKAHFLRAKAYDRLHTDVLDNRFNEIRRYYEDAIYQYPQSPYTPDAYFAIGNMFFRSEIYSEALGYYNLVIEMDQFSKATILARLKKAQIFSVRNKKADALKIYASVIQQYPGLPGTIKAKVGMAVIMYELNQFRNALNILVDLARQPEHAYTYPDILYYLGNIYYQLGSFAKAREQLFRYYNSSPDQANSPLVLARIADAYRESGLAKKATQFYQLVLKRYPQSEGALISMYRLAAMQENGDLANEQGIQPKFNIMGASYNLPRNIYEDVIQKAIEKNESTPLLQFALLKLSILDQKEEKYEDSLIRLKDLMKRYPRTNLKREIEITYGKTLIAIMEKNLRVKKYKHVINIYHAEKVMIERINTPEIYISVARAALKLGLADLGAEMFERASLHMPDKQKPSDLIFYVGREYFRWGELDQAVRYLDLLLKNRPVDQFTGEAWSLKGQIHFEKGEYNQAAKMFANALKFSAKSCDRKDILMYRARAFLNLKSNQNALQILAQAESAVASCLGKKPQMYTEIGKLYMQLGKPKKALAVMTTAHDMANDGSSKARLKIEMARCYEQLNQRDSYLAIYTEVANHEDPFWRNVAREKMEAINFETSSSDTN